MAGTMAVHRLQFHVDDVDRETMSFKTMIMAIKEQKWAEEVIVRAAAKAVAKEAEIVELVKHA